MHNELSKRIEAAVASTPAGPLRTKALKSIRWVLACADGNEGYAILNGTECCLTGYVSSAIKFDGRDNEETKAKFWSLQLGRKMVPVLL